jgi:purine-cytosine permease-like protein
LVTEKEFKGVETMIERLLKLLVQHIIAGIFVVVTVIVGQRYGYEANYIEIVVVFLLFLLTTKE